MRSLLWSLVVAACLLQAWALDQNGTRWRPEDIRLTLAPGESTVLGRRELAAPQADAQHLSIRRDMAGRWWLRNASRRLSLLADDERSDSAILKTGQGLRIGATQLKVTAADRHEVALSDGERSWIYDGARLRQDDQTLPSCPGAPLAQRAALLLHLQRPLAIGGHVRCGLRLGLPGLETGAAALVHSSDGFRLTPGMQEGERTSIDTGDALLAERELDASQLHELVLGHTRFTVRVQEDQLHLAPHGHVTVFSSAGQDLPPNIAWRWRADQPWALPAASALWILPALCLLAALAATSKGNWRPAALPYVAAAVCSAGIVSLLLQKTGHTPAAGWSLIMSSAALLFWMVAGRQRASSGAPALLFAVGLLLQLQLGLGATDSDWLRYYHTSTALLAIGLGAAGLASAVLPTLPPRPAHSEWLLAGLALLALGGLLAEVAWGDETGVFGVQPVEFAKIALCALSAHCLALAWSDAPARRLLPYVAPVLLFLALLALALIQVDDFSPLVLLMVWACSMAFVWGLARRHWTLCTAILALCCGVTAAIVWLRLDGATLLAGADFYGDRFRVWFTPAQHPHTGRQLLQGAHAIAEGGWFGLDKLFGVRSLGQPLGAALAIPAVQDDFAPALFIQRHGLLAAVALWCLQLLLVFLLLANAWHALCAANRMRDFRHAWRARWLGFSLCGGTAFMFGHFLLSWGTNLSILPIMGQPMSFLSAGGSHLLFFLCPLLGLAAITTHTYEESAPCQPTSNMKSWAK